MGLDIGIGDGASLVPSQDEPRLTLDEEEGYYWHMRPVFERVARLTGQQIDMCTDASFFGTALDRLATELAVFRDEIQSEPLTWQVHMYSTISRKSKQRLIARYRTVERAAFLAKVNQLEWIIARSRRLSRPVVFCGD